MPFISALGYDVFNPLEVIPEFTADTGTKKGEKVDYAIKKDGNVIMLFECKKSDCDLQEEHKSQLYRYFSVTESRFGILTNGIIYQFFSDIDERNKMDSKPFFEFNILDFVEHDVDELKKFAKTAFSLADILTTASSLKYTNAIKKVLEEETKCPSEPFIRLFASKIYDGRLTQPVVEKFSQIVEQGWKQFLADEINSRLKSALNATDLSADEEDTLNVKKEDFNNENEIVTTEEEVDAYQIVKAILREDVDVRRIALRDTKSYCGILLDNNNRKPICRLHFNTSRKYIGVIKDKKEERIAIDTIDDIFIHAEKIKGVLSQYAA